jgi:hypothetical protein
MPVQFDTIERRSAAFWAKVKVGAIDECWPWLSYCRPIGPSSLGYGRWAFAKGRVVAAHRAAWMFSKSRDVPTAMLVCHRCDNPPCCNPAHLFVGTVADNNKDRAAKGRTVRGARDDALTNFATGERHGSAKLTQTLADAIRADPRSLSQVAPAFGISERTASRIRQGKSWNRALIAQQPSLDPARTDVPSGKGEP